MFQVLINLIPTWSKGKARVWLSHDSSEIIPLRKDVRGNIVPFNEQVITQNIAKKDVDFCHQGVAIDQGTEEGHDGSPPPSSQNMELTPAATSGDRQKLKRRKICGHCCTGVLDN